MLKMRELNRNNHLNRDGNIIKNVISYLIKTNIYIFQISLLLIGIFQFKNIDNTSLKKV